ncbi:MAG: UDP-N-acetylmuramoyl-L-alanine--D-glutamate ligase [Porphyromonas sp.]|nr:UDP-N-acetylmuramoyl-L-alanine--D-glutamate ligase [Porphyromonas sp.]
MQQKTVILGGGESGIWSAILAQKQGDHVFLSDSGKLQPERRALLETHRISYEEGGHHWELIAEANQVIKSPGIPDSAEIIKKCVEAGIPVISEIEYAARYTRPEQLIGITGSNGKTTTTTLVAHLLQAAGRDAVACGNIGKSLAQCVVNEPHDFYVLELSSFQLDHMYETRLHVAALLNITPDHLDRYDHSLDLYADAKGRVFQNQQDKDTAIYSSDDPETKRLLERQKFTAGTQLTFGIDDPKDATVTYNMETSMFTGIHTPYHEMSLLGKHNAYNILAAMLILKALDIELDEKSLSTFHSIKHRTQHLGTWQGARFVNDSKATNIDATHYALEAMPDHKTHLILGGTDKGNDYSQILDLVKAKCMTLLYLTLDSEKLHKAFDPIGIPSYDLRSIDELRKILETLEYDEGDVVLLSPACASFDLFKNYEDRGNQFIQLFKELKSQESAS